MKIKALKNKVLVTNIEKGMRFIAGFWIPNDDGKSEGIRPHWAEVYAVGSNINDIKPGQWILIEHARWTRMLKITDDDNKEIQLWGIDYPASVLCISDEHPENVSIFSKWT